jgi:hypothetical protein
MIHQRHGYSHRRPDDRAGITTCAREISLLLALCLVQTPVFCAQAPAGAAKAKPAATRSTAVDGGWPRVYSNGTATVAIHQPQVDEWKDFKVLAARSALEIVTQKGGPKQMAAGHWEAKTDTDLENRTVLLQDVRFTRFRVAGKSDAENQQMESLVMSLLPQKRDILALDRVLAYLQRERVAVRQVAISTEAPTILVSTQPAVLVMIDGQPLVGQIPSAKLDYIINTNWDILKQRGESRYYLLNQKQWLTSENLDGPWKAASKLPKEVKQVPADENWADVRKAVPLSKTNKDSAPPVVYVTYKPAELILLKGEPKFRPIQGTNLSEVTNTESFLFYDNASQTYYFLTSGRWFRNQNLRGIWEYASASLPADFAKIPPSHPKASVLASVPGTLEAADAVLLASVPEMAVVNRKEAAAQAKVTYIGTPEFKPIEKTSLEYAVNTPGDVIKHQDRYYLLQQGVWFVSATPNGPWEVADTIPQEFYQIPPESPKHHTTYVYVTDSDQDTVSVAQTAGYMGLTIGVGIGVACWGTGYYYPPYAYWGPMYPYPVYWGYPYHSYGAAAWYNPATGFYGRGAAVYGPYGGYGRSAAYNPATGSYVRRAGAYGPYQAGMATSFYNPRTGAWGGGYRYANAYQGWGEGVVHKGNQWAKGGYYYDDRGAVGGIKTSEGGRLVAAGDGDNRGFVGRTGSGEIYAGKDGNIYRRDQSGNWQQHGDGGWSDVNYNNLSSEQRQRVDQAKSNAQQRQQPGATQASSGGRVQPGTTATTRDLGQTRSAEPRASTMEARPSREVMSGLDRDAGARSRGNQNYDSWSSGRSSSTRSSGGWSGRTGGRMGGGRRR